MPSSPMGKTYLSTAVTEHGHPKQLVANTRIRLEFAVVPNENDNGPRVYDVLRAYAGCNRLGTHTIKYGDLFHHHHRAEEAWIAFEGKRLTAWIAVS
jgi:hypothetical protein